MHHFQQAFGVVLLAVPPLIALSRHISREMQQRNCHIWGGTIIRNVCGCFAILLLAINAFGQKASLTSPDPNSDLQQVDEFRMLFQEREQLVGQKKELEERVWNLWDKIKYLPGSEVLDRNLNDSKQNLERAKKASRPKEELDSLQLSVDTIVKNLEVVRSFAPQYDTARNDLEKRSRRLFAVEQRIASLYDATRDLNRFRTYVTITFGILVLLVIAGFYFIANRTGVAKTIFSGEMGMQFVTLFLIVIAIILFGIMGTLEGRELAALLGGLSGYILGRATSRMSGDEQQTEQNTPGNPPINNA